MTVGESLSSDWRRHRAAVPRETLDIRTREHLLVIYPEEGNDFYAELARRFYIACAGVFQSVALVSCTDLCTILPDELSSAVLAIVNPYECLATGSTSTLVGQFKAARSRIAVLAEAASTPWYRNQFSLSVPFDTIFDVGFIPQLDEHARISTVPYRFIFNAPTAQERASILYQSSSPRPIPWALIGHYTPERVKLVAELLEQLGSSGFVFLPTLRPVQKQDGLLDAAAVSSVLSKTTSYVWCGHHPFRYYESFRFIDSLLAGAIPCKVDIYGVFDSCEIPGVFPSVSSLSSALHREGSTLLYATARDFYLGKGTFEACVKEAFEHF